jgi:glutaconyl-CoA/methylmalonyl-CoA decarboxylase subunit gamma
MRRFLIGVNGTTYEVEVEEVSSFPINKAQQPAVAQVQEQAGTLPAAMPEKKEQPVEPKNEPAPSSGTKILAPMPGKIVSVKAGPGQAVKRGDVLLVLEAMKMENEIQAPVAGTVTAIAVSEGVNVNAGALLACIN